MHGRRASGRGEGLAFGRRFLRAHRPDAAAQAVCHLSALLHEVGVKYHRLRVDVADTVQDEVAARLWLAGSLGVEIGQAASVGRSSLIAYFTDDAVVDEAEAWLRSRGHRAEVDRLEEEDWMAPYRAVTGPMELGTQFVVESGDATSAPEEATIDLKPGSSSGARRRLIVPAQQAFGTGSHATTQLAVQLLEAVELKGASMLDVGTGSGILCFVALALGARRAVGFDLETQSVVLARDNAKRNRLEPELFVGSTSAVRGQFDVVVANVLPDNLSADLPAVASCVSAGGWMIVSGALTVGNEPWLERWREQGLRLVEDRRLEEWTGWLLQRPASAGGELR